VGTSGVRACAINIQGEIMAFAEQSMPTLLNETNRIIQDPNIWWNTTLSVLESLFQDCDSTKVNAISVDGTSGTVLVVDVDGTPLDTAFMYNDSSCIEQAQQIAELAPKDCAVNNPSSALAKLLYLQHKHGHEIAFSLCQASWISGKLSDTYIYTDQNNALKMGYDVSHQTWPSWIKKLNPSLYQTLPCSVEPGTIIGQLTTGLKNLLRIDSRVNIVAGTTDSIAALIASGATKVGEGVTSLGSTLVLKLVSDKPLFDTDCGIYSHKLGSNWLVGGASNSGGAVLKHYFSLDEIQQLSKELNPNQAQHRAYYPLISPGERFPVNNPLMSSGIPQYPKKDSVFLQSLLEGIAHIEKKGYEKLAELGAPYPSVVYSAGGGASNDKWTLIRQNLLGIPVKKASNEEAAYGTAILALKSVTNNTVYNRK